MMFLRPFLFVAATLLATLPARAALDIKEVVSPGGITAWLVEDHGIPFVSLEIVFEGGTSLDAPGKRGATNLMTGLLEEGAADMDSRAFAEARDALAASFSFDSSTDTVSVSVRMLTENRDQAVDLLHKALVSPRFDQDAVDRVREQVLTGLRGDEKDPEAIAPRKLDALAFGDHPYATPGEGSIDSVTALTRDDIVAAWKGAIARDRIFVAAAGDITAEDLALLLDRLFAGCPKPAHRSPRPRHGCCSPA